MILTLPVTMLVEGMVTVVYGAIRQKPVGTLLLAGLMINVLTQILLWIVLEFYFRAYVTALFTTEVLIWLGESLFMLRMAKGGLDLKSAFALSFFMNAASFSVGWFLPI